MRIAYVIGARPNFVKMAPVIAELRSRLPSGAHRIIHTGQHYDRLMSAVFLDELDVPEPDHLLEVGPGSHAVQTARVMERLERVLVAEQPDLVVVAGDVNSTLATTLVSVKLGIPTAHVESGLRSWDRTMPEEVNRIVADVFAQHLFAHSADAVDNLRAEGIPEERVHLVGNTMIDSIVAMEHRFRERDTAAQFGLERGGYLLVTLHRPALVDGPLLADAMSALEIVASDLPVLFPIHPRTRKALSTPNSSACLQLVEPLGYLDFLSLESDARAVLTDSGGIQEESTYLNIPCFTLRDNTERPITVRAGTNTVLGLQPRSITNIPTLLAAPKTIGQPPALWDGRSASRIADIVARVFS